MDLGAEMALLASIAAAFFIGWLVSLDVTGLLISQRAIFKIEEYHRSWHKVAILHAAMHAGLFFFYAMILSGLLDLSYFLGPIWAWFDAKLPFDGAALSYTMGVLSSVAIVIFVWATYSAKIAEDHSKKLDQDVVKGLRFDIRAFYYWCRESTMSNYKKFQFAMALMVAVDMLAVTSFIRVFFKSAKDAAYRAGGENIEGLHFQFHLSKLGISEFFDYAIVAVIIFIVVLYKSCFAIKEGLQLNKLEDSKGGIPLEMLNDLKARLYRIRLLEAFLVMTCLSLATLHLFGPAVAVPSSFIFKLITLVIFSAVLTGLLIRYNGGRNSIRQCVENGLTSPDSAFANLGQWTSTSKVNKSFFWAWVGGIVFVTILLCLAHPIGVTPEEGASRFLTWATILLGLITIFGLYFPFGWLKVGEETLVKSFLSHRPKDMSLLLYCVAVFATLVAMLFLFKPSNDNGASQTLTIVFQIFLILLFTVLFAWARSYRLKNSHEGVNVAEWLAALALAVLVVDLPYLWAKVSKAVSKPDLSAQIAPPTPKKLK